MTGVDEQSRTNDEAVERPMQVRYEQKMAKYGRVAEQDDLTFIPAVFSRIVQIHGEFKGLIKERISQKLIHSEGEARKSKVRSTMKWWSKCISTIIFITTSRNVAVKTSRMSQSVLAIQGQVKTRESKDEGSDKSRR